MVTQVQSGSNRADPAQVTLNGVVTGNLLVAVMMERSGLFAADHTVTGGTGAAWTKLVSVTTEQADGNARRSFSVWTKLAEADENVTVTGDTSIGNADMNLSVEEYALEAGEDQFTFLEFAENDTGTGSTSPLSTGATASVTGSRFFVLGAAIWRAQSSDLADVAWSDGLAEVAVYKSGTTGFANSTAFKDDTVEGTYITEVSWTGAGHEGNAAILVFRTADADAPSVRSFNSGTTSGTTGLILPMPPTIVAGDLLLAFIQINVGQTITSAPTGFTEITNNGVTPLGYWYKKVAVGSDTATFDLSGVNAAGMVVVAVQDWKGTLDGVEISTPTATNDPASLTPSWGSAATLWIVSAGATGGTNPSVTAWPTNYTEIDQATGNFGTDVMAGMASRSLEASSEDPDAFTVGGSAENVRAATLAIQPAGAVTSLFATSTQTIVDVVDETDATSDLHLSVDDDPASPNDADWVNNAIPL